MDQPLTVTTFQEAIALWKQSCDTWLQGCATIQQQLSACQQESDTFKQSSVQEQLRDAQSALNEHMQTYADSHNERDTLKAANAAARAALQHLLDLYLNQDRQSSPGQYAKEAQDVLREQPPGEKARL